jgi:hypothetical protein
MYCLRLTLSSLVVQSLRRPVSPAASGQLLLVRKFIQCPPQLFQTVCVEGSSAPGAPFKSFVARRELCVQPPLQDYCRDLVC